MSNHGNCAKSDYRVISNPVDHIDHKII